MKFISLVPMLLIFIFSSAVSASAGTVAVTDLKVNSANPKLTFIGKGISELIAFELGKSNGAELIEREKRAALSAVENPARVRPKRGIRSDRHNQERHVSEQVAERKKARFRGLFSI